MQALDADCQSIQHCEGVSIYGSHQVMSEGKSQQGQHVEHKAAGGLVSIACHSSQQPGKSVLHPSLLTSPDDSMEDLRAIGKMIGLFVEPLIPQDDGELTIGSHRRFVIHH